MSDMTDAVKLMGWQNTISSGVQSGASIVNTLETTGAQTTQLREILASKAEESTERYDDKAQQREALLQQTRMQCLTATHEIDVNSQNVMIQCLSSLSANQDAISAAKVVALKNADVQLASIRKDERVEMRQLDLQDKALDNPQIDTSDFRT
jgi:hypothetical protein